MKNHKRNRLTWATLAAAVAVGSLVAQDVDPVTQKTQLLSEALAAREKGDLQVALEKFEQIQKISADDEAAKEGIATVKAALAAADKARADAEAAKDSPFGGLIASGAHTFAVWNRINLDVNGDIAWIAGVGLPPAAFSSAVVAAISVVVLCCSLVVAAIWVAVMLCCPQEPLRPQCKSSFRLW